MWTGFKRASPWPGCCFAPRSLTFPDKEWRAEQDAKRQRLVSKGGNALLEKGEHFLCLLMCARRDGLDTEYIQHETQYEQQQKAKPRPARPQTGGSCPASSPTNRILAGTSSGGCAVTLNLQLCPIHFSNPQHPTTHDPQDMTSPLPHVHTHALSDRSSICERLPSVPAHAKLARKQRFIFSCADAYPFPLMPPPLCPGLSSSPALRPQYHPWPLPRFRTWP